MGEHVDTRQLRERKAKRTKKSSNREMFDDGPKNKKSHKTFKQFVNEKTGTYDPEDGLDDDEEFRGIKIK